MQKLNKKTKTKSVGENCVFPHSKGITLIALIITIIVMIILVGVTVNVALNGGLFKTAQDVAENTIVERDRELELSTGEIIDVWVNGGQITLPAGWEEVAKPTEWDNDKIAAVTDGTNTIPLPEGYEISNEDGEHTIEEGVVIKDSKGNEFVWIPVTEDFTQTYSSGSNYLEPTEVTENFNSTNAACDSQITLDYLFGEGFYNYTTNFDYTTHYTEMVESVNKYNGFYIGRYETTIDENNEVGSKYNTTVLIANTTIPQTNNKDCTWYGLYYTQRNSNVIGNNKYLQTNMIWGQQWDAMIGWFDSKEFDYSDFGKSSQGQITNSGQLTNNSGLKDELYNIYDLRTNCNDWTAEVYNNSFRIYRGGTYNLSNSASNRYHSYNLPVIKSSTYASRLTLYIK